MFIKVRSRVGFKPHPLALSVAEISGEKYVNKNSKNSKNGLKIIILNLKENSNQVDSSV